MKKQDPREKAADLLKHGLSTEEEKEILRSLEEEGLSSEEIESIRKLNSGLNDVFAGESKEGMDNRFYAMLQDESRKLERKKPQAGQKLSWMLAAAGIALFILGWFSASWFGGQAGSKEHLSELSGEVKDLKETLVLAMMNQSSDVERLKAVNLVSEFETPDTRIIESLFKVLNTDNNDNVRLLSLEALIKYAERPQVRDGLVASIPNQTSPMIQIRMTEIMVALNEKKAAEEFRKMLGNVNLNYSVRNKMQDAVGALL